MGTDAKCPVITICESRRPLSALDLQLDHRHSQFLQPSDVGPPTRPSSVVLSSASPAQTSERLHPYSYAHSEGSKASNVSFSLQSTTDVRPRGRHFEVAPRRPDALPTSRAAARGITRVASRAPSRASRSRSRAPSRTPLCSPSDLPGSPLRPHAPIHPPAQTNGSQHTLAIPDAERELARHSSEGVPPHTLVRQPIYPIMTVPRYDSYATISPDPADWILLPVTTHFPL